MDDVWIIILSVLLVFLVFKVLSRSSDPELDEFQKQFKGKIYVEPLKTKVNRHNIFWVGRSKYNKNQFRIGIEFDGKRRYFYDWDHFCKDARCSDYLLMSPKEADLLEEKIVSEHKMKKKKA